MKVYEFDIEAAKKLLILNLETRKKHPEIFENRDILSEEFQTALSVYHCLGLRENTKDNHKVTIFRLSSADASKFTYLDVTRLIIALLDCRLVYCDENELINGEISIVDVSNFTFRHFTKIIPHVGIMKAYFNYAQEAAPIRIIHSHFINCSPLMSKLMAIVRPFLKKEVSDSIKFHSSLESLYEFVPKDILPVDFGGTAESLNEYHLKVKEVFEKSRDYLKCDDNWKIED